MTKILVINNDVMMLQSIQRSLEDENYQVFVAKSSQEGLELAWQTTPNVVILELDMPIMDGFETCRRLRELGIQSILITSHLRDDRSVVRALEMGADDYLRQPIEIPILMARIRTLLRRNKQNTASRISVYDDGQLLIDLDNRRVEMRGEPVKLTPTEFRLLAILLRRVGRVVAHEELIREVWGTDKDVGLGSLKLYIHYLRQKIEDRPRKPRYLLAEWGIGYRFREPTRSQASSVVAQTQLA